MTDPAPLPVGYDQVWLASMWGSDLIMHATRDVDGDRTITSHGNTGVIGNYAFTRCGQLTTYPLWDATMSPDSGRFYLGHTRGYFMPVRVLDPAISRPCRRCWPSAKPATPRH